MATGCRVEIADELHDPAWDAFLAQTPGGHHTQTSLWAQVKASVGWRSTRIVATRGGRIVAGAQLLLRPLPLIGAVGYVPRGPVSVADDPEAAALVMDELLRLASARRVQYLSVQPPCNGQVLAEDLPGRGFQQSAREVEPTATVVLDLSPSQDELLARMKMRTRYNVRLGARKGIVVREGTEADIPVFHRLLQATGGRQQFSAHPEEYFATVWRILGSRGHAKLFLADHNSEPLSAIFALAFGKCVYVWRAAWSGRHGNHRPNEALHWAAITWAKAQGYHHYDFEGIDPRLARDLVEKEQGEPDAPVEHVQPPSQDRDQVQVSTNKETVALFKLGFGGRIVLSPGAYDYLSNPLLRWAYTTVIPRIATWPVVSKLEYLLRGI